MRGIYLPKKILSTNTKRIYKKMPIKRGDTFLIVDKTVEDTARMPLSVCRGTEKERYDMAQQCSDKLKESLEKISHGRFCTVAKFKEALDSVLGENKIEYHIFDEKDKKFPGKIIIVRSGQETKLPPDKNGRIWTVKDQSCCGYLLSLPLSKDKSYIKSKYTAFHEARHLLDHIFNPKTLVERYIDAEITSPQAMKAYNNIFSLVHYVPLFPYIPINIKKFQKSVCENLEILDDDIAISVLQETRNLLKTEINAYREEYKYMRENLSENLLYILDRGTQIRSAKLQKKLDVLNELLKERLQKAREK